MSIRDIWIYADDCANRKVAAANRDAAFGYYAFKGQAEWWVQTYTLLDTSVEIGKIANLFPFWMRASERRFGGGEFCVEFFHSFGVCEQIVPDCSHDNARGIGACDNIGESPCSYGPDKSYILISGMNSHLRY